MPTKAGPRKSAAKKKTKTAAKSAAKKTTAKRAPAKKPTSRVATESAIVEFRDGVRAPVWASCATDKVRPVLMHPFLIRTGPQSRRRFFICATDSYQAVKVPVVFLDEEGVHYDDVDESLLGFLAVEAVKRWTTVPKSMRVPPRLTVRKEGATVEVFGDDRSKVTFAKPDGAPVDLAKLIEGYKSDGVLEEYLVGFNPDMLAKIAKALGAGGKNYRPLVIRFVRSTSSDGPTTLRPMLVTCARAGLVADAKKVRDLDAIGVLMPVRVSA